MVSKHFSEELNIELECDSILVISLLYGEHDLIGVNVYAPNECCTANITSWLQMSMIQTIQEKRYFYKLTGIAL